MNNNNLKYLQIVDDLLSEEECNFLITFSEKQGLIEIDRGIAKYHRAEFDNEWLATTLFNRLKEKGLIGQTFNGRRIASLNDHFRFSKYYPGGEFQMHKDGFNVDKNGNRSVMTLNIFLNTEFEGGETDFYLEDKKTLRHSTKPKVGRGAFFDSQQYHCGNKVVNGFKYLLRTDLMVSDIV